MKFRFETGNGVNIALWESVNEELLQNLKDFAAETVVSSDEAVGYVKEVFAALKPIYNKRMGEMLFLMFDEPGSMPADARVDFVYRPTYIVSTIIMTAAMRYEEVWDIPEFESVLSRMLNACLGRKFTGAGYSEVEGLFENLRIFALGDTVKFVKKYPSVNKKFSAQLAKVITYLETEICTGHVRNLWSGDDYIEEGLEVLEMLSGDCCDKMEYVWYACYGSNILKRRFMRYINGCTDKTPPVEDRPFEFPYDIYFAKSASIWSGCGKAFLDDTKEGHAFGRIYKVTREQFLEVKAGEGPDYTKEIELGTVDGFPVYTFTDTQKNVELRMPSDQYYSTILNGLKECYSGLVDERKLVSYLNSKVMPEVMYTVAKSIKNNENYLTNREIVDRTKLDMDRVTDAVGWLLDHGVIIQDGRSRSRHQKRTDMEAFFYTKDCPSGRRLLACMIDAEVAVNNDSRQ